MIIYAGTNYSCYMIIIDVAQKQLRSTNMIYIYGFNKNSVPIWLHCKDIIHCVHKNYFIYVYINNNL